MGREARGRGCDAGGFPTRNATCGRLRAGGDALEERRGDQDSGGLRGSPRTFPQLRVRWARKGAHRGVEVEEVTRSTSPLVPNLALFGHAAMSAQRPLLGRS